jgi:hypothetical protein
LSASSEEARAKRRETDGIKTEFEREAQLKTDFLRFKPAASADDFEKLYPELRAEHLKREAVEGPRREREAWLRTVPSEMRM